MCHYQSNLNTLSLFGSCSGVLWTNNQFQVSTNKLTFIDLEVRLRDKNTVYTRVLPNRNVRFTVRLCINKTIFGFIHTVLKKLQEKRTAIEKEYHNWLSECHATYDKQVEY